MALSRYKLGELIELRDERNSDGTFTLEDVRGVNNLKSLMPTKADMNGRDLSKFQIVQSGEFVFNHRTSRNGSKFSIVCNDEDFSVISDLFHIDPNMRSKLSSLGCSLPKTVAICVLANQLDIPTEVALDNYIAIDNYNIYKQNITALVEIQDLLNYSNEAAQIYVQSLGNRKIIDIVGAIIASNVCDICFSTIVNVRKNTIGDVDFSSSAITDDNRDAYLTLLLQFNLDQAGLDSIIADGRTVLEILENIELWQKSNNFYLTNTNVYLQSASASDIQSVHNKYQMPSSHNIMDDVSISDLYGMMSYSKNLISLSGKNGLNPKPVIS